MSAELAIGCLFDGIHGFGLGLAQAGPFRCAWTIENAEYPRRVLELRVPNAEHLSDVREVRDPPRVHGLTGGFPCQDLSYAGLGAGIDGSRSGLWTQYARIVGEVEPEFVLIENVPALLRRGMELVVENLVELGSGVEWDCLPAAAFGAPHLRDRVWIVAHRLGAPVIFGQPMALFPVTPAGAVELEGDDEPLEGDDDRPTRWARWPRAGWVDGDPRLVMPLEPLARVADVKCAAADGDSRRRWPTPMAADCEQGGTTQGNRRSPNLSIAVHQWPTPKAAPSGPDYARVLRERSGGDDLATAVARQTPGALSPDWVEWLMGFPLGWTDLDVGPDELVAASWQDGEPDGIPRITPRTPHRRERLTALGNALVPAAPEWIAARYLAARATHCP